MSILPPDSETLKLMTTPRCSLPDIVGSEDMLRKRRRRKRYALSGLKWHKTDLTWRCVSCHVSVALSHPCMNHRTFYIMLHFREVILSETHKIIDGYLIFLNLISA